MAFADEAMMQLAEMQSNPNSGNEKLYVTFDMHQRHNQPKSDAEGRPVYDDVEYVRIIVPGDKQNEVHRPASEMDKRRWPRQYADFKSGAREAQSGTPLKEWTAISASQAKELEHFHVYTVEQLANLSDTNIQNIGPIRGLQAKAKDYLEKALGNAPMDKMRAEMLEKDSTIATMKQQMAEMGKRLDDLTKSQGQNHQQKR
jgi:hypothetical protein